MKKIITLILLAAGTISFATAQNSHQRDIAFDDHQKANTFNQQPGFGSNTQSRNDDHNDNRSNNGQGQWKNQVYNNSSSNDQHQQAAFDRNQQYNQRNNGYERQRRSINDRDNGRQQNSKLSTGLVVGGIAAILLGALFSN